MLTVNHVYCCHVIQCFFLVSCDSMFIGVMWFNVHGVMWFNVHGVMWFNVHGVIWQCFGCHVIQCLMDIFWCHVIQCFLVSCDSICFGVMWFNVYFVMWHNLVWCHVIQYLFASCDYKGFFHWTLNLHLHLRDDQCKSSMVGNDLLTRVWQFYHVHRTQNNDHVDWNKNISNSGRNTNVDIKFSTHDTSLT
jgi:hypothetical protein